MGLSEGFTAVINNISLFDYIQLIKMTGKTRTIEILSGNKKAIIQLIKGKVEFAKTRGIKGEEAFLDILTWNGGTLKELNFKQRLKKNVNDTGSLLLKAAENIDNIEMKKNKKIEEVNSNENILSSENGVDFSEDETPTEITTNSLLEMNDFLKNDLLDRKDAKTKNYRKKIKKFEECELVGSCSLLQNLESDILKNAWKLSYCSNIISSKNCARKKKYLKDRVIPKGLLPNGKVRL